MSLNIKNEQAHRLAREIAAITGESMTTVVTEALREKLDRTEGPGAQEREVAILELAENSAVMLAEADLDHGRLLYDDRGLPG